MKKVFITAALCLLLLAGTVFSHPVKESTHVDIEGVKSYLGVTVATGADVTNDSLLKEDNILNAVECGAVALERRTEGDEDTYAVENTEVINATLRKLSSGGGGTLVFPEGTFRVYTIVLEDNVNIKLEKGCVVQAAKTRIYDRDGNISEEAEDFYPDGTPGNYLQPEVNIYAGLQDNGHTYFANSLVYGVDKKNIMIYGEGLFDGSRLGSDGLVEQVLSGWDPSNPERRSEQVSAWFGNKGIALLRCSNIVLEGISMLNCGHFAIIAEGSDNMLVDSIVVDTNRDAFDIDCSQNVTIINSVFNSLTDDAIVFKASYGAGLFMPVYNCLVRNCKVSGYDAGSVLARTYTTDKQVATDQDGPTARVKFGTESTCGYNTVTIDSVRFERSRGLAIEAVDGSDVHDILVVNCTMEDVSSSPVYIRIGNRGRYPVTGNTTDDALSQSGNVRLTNTGWILPLNSDESEYEYEEYPAAGYYPAYNYRREGAVMSNGVKIQTVDGTNPLRTNKALYTEEDGRYYLLKWERGAYITDYTREITKEEALSYGDAVGYPSIASAYNIAICNLTVDNADPRYPITLSGLVDSKINNVTLRDVSVTYRGGMRMKDAVEQRQLTTKWNYTQYRTSEQVQTLPWLVNTFFAKNSALLPRVDWDEETSSWVDDPYNVPEMQEQYPEPTNFGILPSWGIYARHCENLSFENVTLDCVIEDERHAVVLDDCHGVRFTSFDASVMEGVKKVALVSNNYKRSTGFEYVPERAYISTTNSDITGIDTRDILLWTVNAPESGTPSDSLYPYPTVADVTTGYYYCDPVWTYNGKSYSLPVTVYRPFFDPVGDVSVESGENLVLTVSARNPAAETEGMRSTEKTDESLVYSASGLPEGASFAAATHTLTWNNADVGEYDIIFTADDGVIPVSTSVRISVT